MAMSEITNRVFPSSGMDETSEVSIQELRAKAGRYAYIDFGKFNDAKADAEKRFTLLTDYANAFQTLADMFRRDDCDTLLSVAGTNGLSFICRTLSENMYDVLMDLPSTTSKMSKAIRFDHATSAMERNAG